MESRLGELLAAVDALGRAAARLLIEPAEGEPLSIPIAAVLLAKSEKRGVRLVLADGREIVTRPSESLSTLAARLASHPSFVRVHNFHLVNLEHVARVVRLDSAQHLLTFDDGRTLPLTMNQAAVRAYFGIESLDHVIPWNERLAAIIKENLQTFDKDIRFMSDAEIKAHFSNKQGELVIRLLIGNIVWQTYNWIQEEKIDKLDGNIRSFWYSHIKPVLARFFPLSNSFYDALTNVLTEFVGGYHLFRYADMGFMDDSGTAKQVGERLPHIILCAEKQGHWRALQQIGTEAGVTIIALGGQPSLLTTEGLIAELELKGVDLKQRFYLVTDVDYDPSGNIIVEAFRRQLLSLGLAEVLRFDVIQPENFTPEEIQYFKYPVANETSSDQKKTRDWLDKRKSPFGGGLPGPNGEPTPYGLESDAMPRKRLHDLALAIVAELEKAAPGDDAGEIWVRFEQHRPEIRSIWGQEAR